MGRLTPEGKLKARVTTLLRKRGIWYYCPQMTGRGRNGIPDVLICHHGSFIAMELKVKGNNLTVLQMREFDAIEKSGGTPLIIREDTVDKVGGLLDAVDISAARTNRASKARQAEYLGDYKNLLKGFERLLPVAEANAAADAAINTLDLLTHYASEAAETADKAQAAAKDSDDSRHHATAAYTARYAMQYGSLANAADKAVKETRVIAEKAHATAAAEAKAELKEIDND